MQHHTEGHHSTSQHAATHCNKLQTHCNTLQLTATHCITLQEESLAAQHHTEGEEAKTRETEKMKKEHEANEKRAKRDHVRYTAGTCNSVL